MKKHNKYGWYFITIPLILWSVFMIYPIINSLMLSMQSCRGSVCEFVGFDNYTRLSKDPQFIKSFTNSLFFLFLAVPTTLIPAIIFAVLLNDRDTKFKGFFRTSIFLPCVTSLIAYSILFKMLLQTDGSINSFLMKLGILENGIPWLTDSLLAKLTIIIAISWRWIGYNMIFYLAALQGVPYDIYEAAEIDGASKIRQFFAITLPQLKPIILFTGIMSTIGTIQIFDETMNITAGGPGGATMSISQYIYNISFKGSSPDFGYASAMSYVIVIFIVFFSLIQLKIGRD